MLQSVNYVNIGVHLKLRLHFKNSLRGLHAKFSHRKVEAYTLECSDFNFFEKMEKNNADMDFTCKPMFLEKAFFRF
jgi:hypothetical protein